MQLPAAGVQHAFPVERLKGMSGGDANENYQDLLYLRQRFLSSAALRRPSGQRLLPPRGARLTTIYVSSQIRELIGGRAHCAGVFPRRAR
ncbi:MAG: hypothetical protein M3069_17445 [Chloroflexota bacterium]|nr:hypothetical protein [Chloroflexota bacterium]